MQYLEPYGTTPLPLVSSGSRTPYHVNFNPNETLNSNRISPQQPQTQQIAALEASPNDESLNGASVIAVNQHFVCYAVKNGLIRVLHRHSTLRTLLRAHTKQRVTDIQFFKDGEVLATAGTCDGSSTNISSIVIWRLFERSPEIVSEKLLEISTDKFSISRVLWHPCNPNQFWMVHGDRMKNQVATLVETTRIATTKHPTEHHAVCSFYRDYLLMEDALQLKPQSGSSKINLVDLCWNGRDSRLVLAIYDSGQIILWDLQGKRTVVGDDSGTSIQTPSVFGSVFEESEGGLSRCFFLPHEDCTIFSNNEKNQSASTRTTTCFVTASKKNSTFTIWSPWRADGKAPAKLQTVSLVGHSSPTSGLSCSYLIDVCFGPAPPDASPPSCFIVVADRDAGKTFAFHCGAEWSKTAESAGSKKCVTLLGCDYVVPFTTKYPTYSWSVICAPSQDITEESLSEYGGLVFDIKLFSYQSAAVQCLTLTSLMCLPPSSTWTDPTPGVTVTEFDSDKQDEKSGIVSDIELENGVVYDEDYDVGDDDDADDYDLAPEAADLPTPNGLPGIVSGDKPNSVESQNPFANWLGAIAAKSLGNIPPPPPPVPVKNNELLPPLPSPQVFLSPMEMLAGQAQTKQAIKNDISTKGIHRILTSRDPTPTAANKEEKVGKLNTQQDGKGRSSNNKSNATSIAQTNTLFSADKKISILKRDANVKPLPTSSENSGPETVSSSVVTTVNAYDETTIRRVVREEVQDTIIPFVRQTICDSMTANSSQNTVDSDALALSIAPLQRSIDAIANQDQKINHVEIIRSLSDAVHEPIHAVFADCTKSFLIPAIEAITGQVLAKVSEQMESASLLHREANISSTKELESMSAQLTTMTQLVAKLTEEVHSLRQEVAIAKQPATVTPGSATDSVPQPPKPLDSLQARKDEILVYLHAGQFEVAFTKAVSASTAELVIFCCRNADLFKVFGGEAPILSQPILLCLLQQLGTVVLASESSDSSLALDWLLEIAVSINPHDANIRRHVSSVFQQVMNNVNQKLYSMQGTDHNLQHRRQLQRMLQLLRGGMVPDTSEP